jgi:MYXO-CTERM domain-containing protein
MGCGIKAFLFRAFVAVAALLTASAYTTAHAQAGLIREFYDRSPDAELGNPAAPPPGSVITTPAPFAEAGTTTTVPNVSVAGVTPTDFFVVAWTGNITPVETGAHFFGTISDDGIRLWVNGVLLRDDWVDQGPAGAPEMGANSINLTMGVAYTFRVEMYERQGGERAEVYWRKPSDATPVLIPDNVFTVPAPPAAPVLSGTAAYQMNSLSWTAPAGANSYILEVSVGGGAFTQIFAGAATVFTHNGLTNGTAYTYRVRAIGNFALVSANSNLLVLTPFAPPPRTNSHDEGLLGDNCACGSSIPAPAWPALAGLAGLALMAVRRRR